MRQEDYPALHADAEAASADSQRHFYLALAFSLICLVLTAALSSAPAAIPWLPVLQAGSLLLSLGASLYLAFFAPQKTWYETRALAESVKTVTWRYMMKAEPYDLQNAHADTAFTEALTKILADNKAAQKAIARTQRPQITDAMKAARRNGVAERVEFYRQHRVEDQLVWYRKKVRFNEQRSRYWFWGLVVAHILAIGFALARTQFPDAPFWPTDSLAALAAGVLAWLQAKRFQELSASYSLTAHEIGILSAKLSATATASEFSMFVGDAENAFSREHTQWRARLDTH